jgi:hypothetical protein
MAARPRKLPLNPVRQVFVQSQPAGTLLAGRFMDRQTEDLFAENELKKGRKSL